MPQDPQTRDKSGVQPMSGEQDDPQANDQDATAVDERPREIGGRKGPDPTRFGDWEKNGRCIDF